MTDTHKVVHFRCDSGLHELAPVAEVQRMGPDGEVVALVIDAEDAVCPECAEEGASDE